MLFLSILYSQIIGSGMTTSEEAQALCADTTIQSLIQNTSDSYVQSKLQYEQGSCTWEQLKENHDLLFSTLLSSVKERIQASHGIIHSIAYDYDTDHEQELLNHLQILIGLCQQELHIPPESVFLPPLPETDSTYPNLVIEGDNPSENHWILCSGSGSLTQGQLVTSHPNGASFCQTIPTSIGHWYLISGDIVGAYEGQDPYDNPLTYSGSISADHVYSHFVQTSDEIDNSGLQRRYFWVQATEPSITLYLSGAAALQSDKGPIFHNINVRDLQIDCSTQTGQTQAMTLAQRICPPVSTTGSNQVGWYPQIENALTDTSDLLDTSISIMNNVDTTPGGNAGHPYWYFAKGQNISIINGKNGSHGLIIPLHSTVTTNGPVPIPSANYTLSCDIYLPSATTGSIRITFAATDLNANTPIPSYEQEFSLAQEGVHHISFLISQDLFPSQDRFFRPSVTFDNLGNDPVYLYNPSLLPNTQDVYTKINAINPYDTSRSWYQPHGYAFTYDFTQGEISSDWAIALTGNTMFAAKAENVSISSQGIVLQSHSYPSSLYDSGGIQSTQLIDPMRNFQLFVSFTVVNCQDGYAPTFAIWTYGESQKGPDDPLSHRNSPSADPITEFDCEMGSNPQIGQSSAPTGQMYMRPGSYIGHAVGGHNEIVPTNWPLMPNFWQKTPTGDYDTYTVIMTGSWSNDRLTLRREIKNVRTGVLTPISIQDLGSGPFSPMYIKIALENPSWNDLSHTTGSASIAISQITFAQGDPIPTLAKKSISPFQVDYTWFTPGGGGGMAYTSFLPRSSY